MLTIKACGWCNQEKGKLDTYFRDYTVVNMETASSRHARALADGIKRSTRRNQSEFMKHSRLHLQYADLHTKNGIFLGRLPIVPVDDKKVERYLDLIARGLSLRLCKARIPNDYQAAVRTIPIGERVEFLKTFNSAEFRPQVFAQESEVFCVFYIQIPEFPAMSIWLMVFFDSIIHIVDFDPLPEVLEQMLSTERDRGREAFLKELQ